MLRQRSIPARVRCGFATYFTARPYEDHWICEYWLSTKTRWVHADAQLDRLHRDHLGIRFDCADLPRGAFLTAGQAWKLARTGLAAPDEFGNSDAKGLWFLRVNVHRDLLALTNQHTSAWDTWRNSTELSKVLSAGDAALVDHLAHEIELAESAGDCITELKEIAARAFCEKVESRWIPANRSL